MSDPAVAAALCLLLTCTPALAQNPARGCVLLNPVQPNVVTAKDLSSKDLCTRDGKAISSVSVGNSQAWEGKLVPPYNRVTMRAKGEPVETNVTFQTPSATYQVHIKP
mgnify:CR=1 FL=1